MALPKVERARRELNNQFLFFCVVFTLADLVAWAYYSILLLRESNNDVAVVFTNFGMLYTGLMLGFLFEGKIFSKIGYKWSFRLSNILQAIVLGITILTLNDLLQIHLILALMRGVARGLFWDTKHLYAIKEIHAGERAKLISLIYSLDAVLGVILPFLIGAVISSLGFEGYAWTFAAGIVIYLLAAIYPWEFNKVPRDKMSIKDFWAISKKKGFKRWAALSIGMEVINNQRTMIITVLPFLFIGDEFGVGLLGSAVGLAGAVLAFWHRNDFDIKRIKLGYLGGAIIDLSTIGLIIVWNLPALVIRSLLVKLGIALHNPIMQDKIYQVRELIVGDFTDQYSVEVQQYSEFFLYVGRLINLVLFIFLFFVWKIDQDTILRGLLAITLISEIPNLFLHSKLVEQLSRGKSAKPRSRKNLPLSLKPAKGTLAT